MRDANCKVISLTCSQEEHAAEMGRPKCITTVSRGSQIRKDFLRVSKLAQILKLKKVSTQ